MGLGRYPSRETRVPFAHAQLWLAAALLFGVADLAATTLGLGLGAALDLGSVAAPLLGAYGPRALVAAKLGAFVGSYALWRLLPRPYRAAGPVGLALLGAILAGWRIWVVTVAVLG